MNQKLRIKHCWSKIIYASANSNLIFSRFLAIYTEVFGYKCDGYEMVIILFINEFNQLEKP